MPVAAGLVVVMAVAAGWYLVGPGSGGSHKQLPADGQSLPVAQAWDAIIAAARTAEPTAIPDGSVIRVSQVGEGASMSVDGSQWQMMNQDRDAWFDPRGMVPPDVHRGWEEPDGRPRADRAASRTPT